MKDTVIEGLTAVVVTVICLILISPLVLLAVDIYRAIL